MRRVVSLYLPSLATDRLRRLDPRPGGPPPDGARSLRGDPSSLDDDDPSACSCPRGGGWRPGARWAQGRGAGAAMDDRDARIAAMPAHQRPSPRELGRRSEPAGHPFKAMPADDGGAGRPVAAPDSAFSWGGRPMVVAAQDRGRVVVVAADAIALERGLAPGMALTHARALEPDLDVRDADPRADRALLDRLTLFAVRRWTPTAMVDESGDGILMDVTGAAHLHGGEEEMARRIVRFCRRFGLDARVGAAATIGAAHALARHGGRRVVVCGPHGEPEALAALPIAALRLDGGQRAVARRLGIDRVGDLLAMPRAPLARRLGASLLDRLDQAIGRVGEPFDAFVPYVVPQEQIRFAEPIGGADGIAAAMGELVAALADTLRVRGLGARVVRLVCDRVDREVQVVVVGMAKGTRDVRHILRLLAMRIETIDPGFGIDAMRLIAARTEPLDAVAVDGDLGGEARPHDLEELVDQIAVRLGETAAFRPSAVESDVPERSVVRIGPLAEAVDWDLPWPRPVRLLPRPERIDGVIALMPDQPPRRFVWRGATHVVVRADGPERITGEWWRRTSEAFAVRDYFRLEDERGERYWVFRRGNGEHGETGDLSWWLHGVFG